MSDIFVKFQLSDFIFKKRNQLVTEIDKLEVFDTVSHTQILEDFVRRYTLEPLKLNKPVPEGGHKETNRHIKDPSSGIDIKQKVFEVNVRLTFEGEGQLFYCRPPLWYKTEPTSFIFDPFNKYIIITIQLADLSEQMFQHEVDKAVNEWELNIPGINAGVRPWNSELRGLIDALLIERKLFVGEKHRFLQNIGLKINPASDQFMIPPPIAKKFVPKPVSDTSTEYNKQVTSTLQEEVYNDIIEVLYNVGRAIERKPSLYNLKYEEDLRDMFILFLETRYESTAGVGEAFNKKGKTDILLKYTKDGTNIFVAECKFWTGPRKYHETIDQLFGYLTTRDSKAAIMIFVDQKNFQGVITSIKKGTPKHPQYEAIYKERYDSSFGYKFSLPDDQHKIIQVEVMLFHFPKL
ncbi:MAG: hypothetical protein WKF97_16355 [Chitinophagaceae bacterium]